jgi:iron complex outermembrane receptor protein
VNVSNSDAFGLNGGSNVQVHGLPQNDLGFILDGIPVYNSGAGYSNETIETEDLATLSVAPGTSTLDTPSTGSAAGTMYMSMRDPSKEGGVFIGLGAGTLAFNREYVRLDSGEFGPLGTKAFLSFTHTEAKNWRGGGNNDKRHVDFKVLQEFGNNSRVALEGSVNQQYYGYYYYPSAAQFADYDAQYNNFNTHSSYQYVGDTSYYELNRQTPSYTVALGLPVHFVASDFLTIDDTPYLWMFYGAGTGGTDMTVGSTYQGTQLVDVDLTNGGKISPTNGQILVDSAFGVTTIQRGNVLKLTGTLGPNTLMAGLWYESYSQFERDPVAQVDQATGVPVNPWKSGGYYHLSNGSPYYYNSSDQLYRLTTPFIGDTLALLDDKLKISAGVKHVATNVTINNFLPGARPQNKLDSKSFLPQFTAHFQLDEHNQFYAAYEKDFRLSYTYALIDYYNINSGALNSAASSARPEIASKEEVGYRYQNDLILSDLSFFNIHLTDRLLGFNEILNGQPISLTSNSGNATSRGVDFQIATRPLYQHYSPFISFEYLHATTDSNVSALNTAGQQDYLPTTGKTSPQAPKVQIVAGLSYENGPYKASARAKYVGSQYSTLMNDERMPGFITNDFSLSYNFGDVWHLRDSKIQLNLSNITNARYRSGVDLFYFNAQSAVGTRGGVIGPAGTPLYYVQPSFAAVLSVSAGFR